MVPGVSEARCRRSKPGRPPMRVRNFRVRDRLWDASIATADAAGDSLPERIREFLEWYSRQPGARAPRRPAPRQGIGTGSRCVPVEQ